MFQKILILSVLFVIGIAAVRIIDCPASQADSNSAVREKAGSQFNNGNYKDAFSLFEKLCLDPANDPRQTGTDLNMGVSCLASLNRVEEVDEFREKVIEIHKNNWRLLYVAAKSYTDFQHYGFMIAGKFTRGGHRGGGQYADVSERDRGRALQLMDTARILMEKESAHNSAEKSERADFFLTYADMLLRNRGYNCAWRLQYLTDIKTLPDWQDNNYSDCGQTRGAPVDAEGNPIYYYLPQSWDSAKNDGQRWRWLLRQAVNANEGHTSTVKQRFADFLHSQFGVQTMMPVLSIRAPENAENADKKEETGIYALHTLAEEETIAKLATGIKRFRLPDEFNFIRIYKEIGNNSALAQIFENRRQYAKAAEFWKLAGNPDKVKQITANWGAFEPLMTQPAGKGATVDYRFRNGSRVRFTAHSIKIETLLSDVKKYIKSNPRNVDGNKENPENIGYRIVSENEDRYLDQQTAQWALDLNPRAGHFDKRITVSTPLQEPGAYLLTAEMEDGNVSRILIWIDNTAIVRKNLDNGILWYVADAVTGKPVENANVEFFGYRREWKNKLMGNDTEISDFAEYTDKNGQIVFGESGNPNRLSPNMRWIAIATHTDGRLAFTGFTHIWYSPRYDQEYNESKVFAITDRPVYRPGQSVKFKCWVRKAQYDQANVSDFAGSTFPVQLNNPQGEKIWEQNLKADDWGGISAEYALPEEAMLGVYQLYIPGYGGGSFRVEEYKKPEFEVTVQGPEEAIRLGDTVKAKITAKYYFGAPVTHAKVKYKVLRYEQDTQWYPIGPWDWLYGSGYGWFGYDYLWYPGWKEWGCRRPFPWWWQRPSPPPELLMDNEVPIAADGTVEIPIDTQMAKDLHGDTDHRYEITAEVTDLSRRTIVGRGSVTAARKPFKVYAWTDRGYYRSGDTIQAGFSARTPEGKDVDGNALIHLYRISYENDKPAESEMQKWEIRTGENRDMNLQMTAASAGQYRLSCTVTDSRNQKMEGAYLFTVRGDGFDGRDFRFNALELIPEKSEYAPGEKVKLMINTDRVDSTVLLFVRPANGVYLPPKVIRMKGKSLVEEIEVIKKDMPNFFVEILTVADGKVHTEAKEIAVPPQKRVVNVEVMPSSEQYKPGEKAEIKVKLTDYLGEPFRGSTVLSVYDKAVEYISGGSNVPEIKAFFWKWRRHHNPVTESSLDRVFHNLLKQKEIPMQALGIFGHSVADEDGNEWRNGRKDKSDMRMMKSARGLGQAMPAPSAPMLEAAADMSAPKSAAKEEKSREAEAPAEAGAGQSNMQEAVVRTQFADTAFWSDSITADKQGMATVSFTMPENLSAWKIKTWAMGHGTAVGEGTAETVTAKNLMVRLQAPRFFVQKDEVVLSANVHNYLKSKKQIQAVIELDGPCLQLTEQKNRTVTVDPNGEMRVDWRVSVLQEGEAIVRMKALTDEESDAMEMRFPVYVHGMDKMVPFCGVIRPEQNNALITMEVPQERRQEASRLEIRYSPTLAGAMVDALPYLTDYPYGCTEQTLNRFVPTVITLNVLNRLGLDLKKIQEKQSNLNAQEIGNDKERAAQWKRYKRNPVFDETEVMDMVKTGVQRLSSMQLSDGGWGWFSGWGEYSYPHTTAVVVHGLQIAQKNGAAVVPSVLQEGIQWLQNYEKEQVKLLVNGRKEGKKKDPWKSAADNLDAFVYMVLADAGSENGEMREFLYSDRNSLSVYGKAMYGLALHVQGHKTKLDMIMQNISQYVVQDEENQTAYLNLGNEGYWWYWYGSEIEAHAYYLKLLSKTDPKSETASRMVKYLLNNRKHSTYWNSTRDTAVCIEAFADYLEASGEDKPDMTVEILVDGNLKKTVRITAENLFAFDNSLLISGDAVETGKHTVEIRRKGKGPLYFNAYLSYFTLEDYISKAGLEIKVERQYYRLRRVDKNIKVAGSRGQALDQKVEKYERVPLENLALLKSGDLVEVELVMESKNDYEYILFEDMKAAGFEPVEVRSGYTDNAMRAYTELRDEKVAFFVRALARGKHSMSYRLRAEIPGKFSALPTKACGMYAPELRANSDEIKLRIED